MGKRNIAVITGASSGFGREFVKLLVEEDSIDEIWAVARNEDRLKKLVDEFGGKLRTFAVDLSNKREIKVFHSYLEKADVNILYLVNNAGYGKFCSYEDLDIEESINMIDLNINAVVALGLLCIPYMEKGSHIINIASQASFQPLPYLNIYSATKAFVRNYSRALNVELKNKGITVTAVCPGWMKTAFFDRADIGAAKGIKNFMGITSPDRVAKKALEDARRGKDMSVYGVYVKFAHVFAKIMPQRLVMKIWLGQQRIK